MSSGALRLKRHQLRPMDEKRNGRRIDSCPSMAVMSQVVSIVRKGHSDGKA